MNIISERGECQLGLVFARAAVVYSVECRSGGRGISKCRDKIGNATASAAADAFEKYIAKNFFAIFFMRCVSGPIRLQCAGAITRAHGGKLL